MGSVIRALLLGAGTAATVAACARATNLLEPGAPVFSGAYAPHIPDTATTSHIRIVTFNIKLGRRIDRAIVVLRSDSLRDADILALEEMDDAGVARIARALRLNYVYYPGSIHPTDHRYFGPAILSRWPIERSWKLFLPHKSRLRHQQRTATVAELRLRGQRIRVYAVHLETPFRFSDAARKDQVPHDPRRRVRVRRSGGDRGRFQQLRDRPVPGAARLSLAHGPAGSDHFHFLLGSHLRAPAVTRAASQCRGGPAGSRRKRPPAGMGGRGDRGSRQQWSGRGAVRAVDQAMVE